MKCPLCNCPVEVIGNTTKHYEIKFSSDKDAAKEVWRRIHKRETKEDYPLPQHMVREITADAYWMACYDWLKKWIVGENQ